MYIIPNGIRKEGKLTLNGPKRRERIIYYRRPCLNRRHELMDRCETAALLAALVFGAWPDERPKLGTIERRLCEIAARFRAEYRAI